MGMKIQAITSTDGLNVAVGKTYYIEDTGSDITGKFEVTHLEVIAAGHSSASGVEVRAEIVVGKAICKKCGKFAVPIGKVIWCGCTK